jgi:peptide-methionine (S)-S-oxide reductase
MNDMIYGSLRIEPEKFPDPEVDISLDSGASGVAVLAGGCFWCTEAVFRSLDGVVSVCSGYSGGTRETADYKTVCSGTTDHAEAIEIKYDPSRTSFGEILKIFFSVAHDPTQLNHQGNDYGRQYRSAIFYADEDQKKVAEAYIAQLTEAGAFSEPIVTTLEPLETFYQAEEYHQDFAARNPMQPYVMHVSAPKVQKFREHFGDRMKK